MDQFDIPLAIAKLEAFLHANDSVLLGAHTWDIVARHASRRTPVSVIQVAGVGSVAESNRLIAETAPVPTAHTRCWVCRVCGAVEALRVLLIYENESHCIPTYVALADALRDLRKPLEVVLTACAQLKNGYWDAELDEAASDGVGVEFTQYETARRTPLEIARLAQALYDLMGPTEPALRDLARSPDFRRSPSAGRPEYSLLNDVTVILRNRGGFDEKDIAEFLDDKIGGGPAERLHRVQVRLGRIKNRLT